ncbi:MAG: AsmA-like C-terminal region-containing protein [Chitinophagaceae bacterium]
MATTFKKIVIKTLKITGISIAVIVGALAVLPMLFPEKMSKEIKALINRNITGDIHFNKARFTFFNHFPTLTLTLYDVDLKGSAPFEKDTLLSAKELALGINLSSLLSRKIKVDQLFLTESNIQIFVDKNGNANYNVYASSNKQSSQNDSSSASLKIERIVVERSNIIYNDASLPMYFKAGGLNYEGKGDLSKAIFDLASTIEIESADFEYNHQSYFLSKKLTAELITKINTHSLAFIFERNDLKINKLPVNFKGKFEFLKEGYNMNFQLNSNATELKNIITAFPPEYLQWLEKTRVEGTADIDVSLNGKYIASSKTLPDLTMKMGIRGGYIAYENAPIPVSNLFLNFETKLPGFNTDSLYVNIDSIFFNVDKDYFSSVFKINGLKQPTIQAKINTAIDLERWDKALGIAPFDVKGILTMQCQMNGKYATAVQVNNAQKDTVITSIPSFKIQSTFSNGYFKYASLPLAMNNIGFSVNASCNDHQYKHIQLSLEKLNANFLGNYLKGFFKIGGAEDMPVDMQLQSSINLADIQKVFPLDGLILNGKLNANVTSNGVYNQQKNVFPKTQGTLKLVNASIKTKYYPNAIKNIHIQTVISNTSGSLKDMIVKVAPASFSFEDKQFTAEANLSNFNNIQYNIAAKGIIDIGKMYKVFAIEGMNIDGLIAANVSLKGNQNDVLKGLYHQLQNSGNIQLQNIAINYNVLPKPFTINNGLFVFKQDKIVLQQLLANYGSSTISAKGYLTNIINYVMKENDALQGNISVESNKIIVDEWMAFANDSAIKNHTETGVVIIPKNLQIQLQANTKEMVYNGLSLKNVQSTLLVNNGTITAKQTGFKCVDANVSMEGSYQSLTPTKALFKYHITADSFDIRKAYNQIDLLRTLATSAKSVQGVAALDYSLQGKLNNQMMPIYPSLTGGGTLTINNLKVKGLKLFSAVSKATNRDSVNNPSTKKLVIKTQIKNNIITIEKTKMKVFGFRPKFEGQVSFDGRLNLKFRLGLPPLGIFGIPMTITGTQENPKIKLGRGKKEDELTETPETEETDNL